MDARIEKEKKTVEFMIRLYCRAHKHSTPCRECEELIVYTFRRLENCPFGANKTACKRCPIHCYHPEKREKIRSIMRYIGPRMWFYAPVETLRHFLKK